MVLFDKMMRDARPLSKCLQRAREEGYTENFKLSDGSLYTEDGKYSYEAADFTIDSRCRFDGNTPGDDSTVYLMETRDGRRGVLVDVHGPYAQTPMAAFIRIVEHFMEHEKLRERRTWKEFLKGY
jgi:hypothetical protein